MFFSFGRGSMLNSQVNLDFTRVFKNFFNYYNLRNLIANIVLFIPFGLLKKLTKWSYLKFVFAIIIIEMLQFIFLRGIADIDDVILNSIGFLIGYFLITKINFLKNL
jgi:glycopeptide antibiotics resistance protein